MDKWVWVFTNPGSKIFPEASIILSTLVSSISSEISAIKSFLIKRDCLFSSKLFGFKINAFLIKIVLFDIITPKKIKKVVKNLFISF